MTLKCINYWTEIPLVTPTPTPPFSSSQPFFLVVLGQAPGGYYALFILIIVCYGKSVKNIYTSSSIHKYAPRDPLLVRTSKKYCLSPRDCKNDSTAYPYFACMRIGHNVRVEKMNMYTSSYIMNAIVTAAHKNI